MIPVKTFVICACLVLQNTGATQPDVLTKRDSSPEVDPYAAYYSANTYDQAAYAPQELAQSLQTISEKQGFAASMENVFGDDAALVLGTIGALMGTLAAVGVVLNNNNINHLSLDQDAICTSAKALGNLAVPAITATSSGTADTAKIFADLTAIRKSVVDLTPPTRC